MSETLPYFKFYASIYLSKKIMLMPFDVQGIFGNLMALNWAERLDIPMTEVKRHLMRNPDRTYTEEKVDKAIETLTTEKIIKVKRDGTLVINFQSEQWTALSKEKKAQSNGGKKGAESRYKKKETGETHVEAAPKDEKTVNDEKARLAKFKKHYLETFGLVEAIARNHKVKAEHVPKYLDNFHAHVMGSTVPFEFGNYKTHFNNWMYNSDRIEDDKKEATPKVGYSINKKKE